MRTDLAAHAAEDDIQNKRPRGVYHRHYNYGQERLKAHKLTCARLRLPFSSRAKAATDRHRAARRKRGEYSDKKLNDEGR